MKRLAIVSGAILVIIVLTFGVGVWSLFQAPTPGVTLLTPTEEPEPEDTPLADLETCRVNAVTAYMQEAGFQEGAYTVGEENIDTEAEEYSAAGANAFGNVVGTRAELAKMFSSDNAALKAATEVLVRKNQDYDRKVVLDPSNWEIVQVNTATSVSGNTGFANGKVVDAGTRASAAGDAYWLFIDVEACSVPASTVKANGQDTDDSDTVTIIRVGCINPGDGIKPKNPSLDPENRGNNRPGGGGTAPGPDGPATPPAGGDPPVTYEPPAPPEPTDATPDPTPAPPQEPEAPTPETPATGCVPAPGRTCP